MHSTPCGELFGSGGVAPRSSPVPFPCQPCQRVLWEPHLVVSGKKTTGHYLGRLVRTRLQPRRRDGPCGVRSSSAPDWEERTDKATVSLELTTARCARGPRGAALT